MANTKTSKKQNKSIKREAVPDRLPFPLLRTGILFGLLVTGLHLVQWTLIPRQSLDVLQILTAKVTATVISASGIPLSLNGTHISLLNTQWEIILECTALSAFIVFSSFVLAYPSGYKSKIVGVLIGLPTLFTANIMRLFVLAWATKWSPDYATIVHDYVWQILFLLLLVLMWLAWIELVVKREKLPDISG